MNLSPVRTALRFALCATLSLAAEAQLSTRATFFGGNDHDRIQGVVRDAGGRLFVVGHTKSTNFGLVQPPGTFGFDPIQNGDADAFVARLSPDLGQVEAWTYLGGTGHDRGYGVLLDSSGRVVVTGFTRSADFPRTTGPGHGGGLDVFVARLSPDLKSLVSSRFLGGNQDETARASFTLDAQDNLYLSGRTSSADFPIAGAPFQAQHAGPAGTWDAFVAKLSPSGALLWSTYLGGSGNDVAYSGIRVAANGQVTVAGMTRSSDFPTTPGAFQRTYGGHGSTQKAWGDGFVARLAPGGGALVWSTYVGGSGDDAFSGNDGLEVDAAGRVFVVGQTRSADFPTTVDAYDRDRDGQGATAFDGVVVRLAPDGRTLEGSTYVGGSGSEELSALALDPWDNVYLSGNTTSGDFPTTVDALDRQFGGGSDVVLVRLDSRLRRLDFASYLGGAGQSGYGDRGRSAFLTDQLEYVLVGDTDSPGFPVDASAAQPTYAGGSADGFALAVDLVRLRSFGTAKTSSIGKRPALGWNGTASAATGGFQLQVRNLPPGVSGVLFFGQEITELPFHGGTLYAQPPLRRSAVLTADASGRVFHDVLAHPGLVGASAVFQFWFADPAHPDGTGVGLSGGLKVIYLP